MSEFDFIDDYAEPQANLESLAENAAESAINVAFIGVGGGGCKIAKAFLDLGFTKTILLNTTTKDFQTGINEDHLVALPGADGLAKNIELGRQVLAENSAFVEDALRTKLGKVDWLFVCAGGGGGTGSSAYTLDPVFKRFLETNEATGKVVYMISQPSAQEKLNSTIKKNAASLLKDVQKDPHIVLDNEKQLNAFRGRVGVLGLYPAANKAFAKMFWQLLRLADEPSPVQVFDGKDLERFLSAPGRMVVGSSICTPGPNLGVQLYQSCLNNSPCPTPKGHAETGVLLQVITEDHANDVSISGHLEASTAYVGGRTNTLFSGIYVRDNLPGLVTVLALGGLK